jgi:hypothetical protein
LSIQVLLSGDQLGRDSEGNAGKLAAFCIDGKLLMLEF